MCIYSRKKEKDVLHFEPRRNVCEVDGCRHTANLDFCFVLLERAAAAATEQNLLHTATTTTTISIIKYIHLKRHSELRSEKR